MIFCGLILPTYKRNDVLNERYNVFFLKKNLNVCLNSAVIIYSSASAELLFVEHLRGSHIIIVIIIPHLGDS